MKKVITLFVAIFCAAGLLAQTMEELKTLFKEPNGTTELS